MKRRIILKKILEDNPFEKWNQFIDLLAMEDYKDLTEIQRVAYLCFWYDSEVQNGGHLQYFVNRGTSLLKETELSLVELGALQQISILSEAINVLCSLGISPIEGIDDYIAEALEGKYCDIDSKYYSCKPTISDLLEKYFQKYEDEFVLIE
ncbi:DUF4375 domain-containing protein [Ruminiclostridium herbifermentans]|uniref:DUF4375 domain-containing protein n=1 Tax=Ruminiclostridium herbifermentans TaxID=2488810 RepID=A0A7H1VS25_9FIRM|nr:DUF4375 domain-containing protein [Ruminiclostridium herbifermentans]QNU68187.1 DUF4375 domain-containing protein [Ruminiclostridium herbifermentans]